MKKQFSKALLISMLLQVMPLHSQVQIMYDYFEKTQVKVMTISKMSEVSGGTGGGSSSSSGGGCWTPPKPSRITDISIPGIPYYNQHVTSWDVAIVEDPEVNGVSASVRSNYYCGIACASMISAYREPYQSWKNSRDDIERHFIEIDDKAFKGEIGSCWKSIDVNANHGFFYMGTSSDSNQLKMDYSIWAIEGLYDDYGGNNTWIDPYYRLSADNAFERIWNHVENKSLPGVVVMKTGKRSLHYVVVSGIYKNGSDISIYRNDPANKGSSQFGGGSYVDTNKAWFIKQMKISNNYPENFEWIGDFQKNRAIFGLIN